MSQSGAGSGDEVGMPPEAMQWFNLPDRGGLDLASLLDHDAELCRLLLEDGAEIEKSSEIFP